jgi:glycosyltransferase involved in cell wall biosynthesis
MRPSISILTPVRNGMPLIRECITSVLSQEHQDWELIISDNGSTDETIAYLDSLDDPRIRVFKQPENLGIMGNLNFLFNQATAPICQMLCADDYFLNPKSLSVILDYWNGAAPSIGLVRFGYSEPMIQEIFNEEHGIPTLLNPGQANIWFFTFGNFMGNLSDVSVRTHLIAEAGNFKNWMDFAGDCELWTRLAQKVSMGIERMPVVYIRQHEKSASSAQIFKGLLYDQQIGIYERLIEELSFFHNRKQLVDYFNYEICSLHYRLAIKAAFHGKYLYFNKLLHTQSPILWPRWKQLLVCLVIGGLNMRRKITHTMGISLINKQLQYQQSFDITKLNPFV